MVDKKYIIYDFPKVGNSFAQEGHERQYTWPEFTELFKEPIRTPETVEQYHNVFTNEQRAAAKNVGGFIAGMCEGGRRRNEDIKSRTLLVIDDDFSSEDAWADYTLVSDWATLMHTTHSHTISAPKRRWIFPMNRDVSFSEYRALATYMSRVIGGVKGSACSDVFLWDYWPDRSMLQHRAVFFYSL